VIYFEDLNYEDCLECAEEILKEAKANREIMILSRDTHKAMAVEFKQLEDKVGKVEMEAKSYEEKASALKARAESQQTWAIWLAFIPVVGAIASPILTSKADSNLLEAVVAKGSRACRVSFDGSQRHAGWGFE